MLKRISFYILILFSFTFLFSCFGDKDIDNEYTVSFYFVQGEEIKEYSLKHRNALWDEYVRILNPEDYPVDLSQKAWDHKMNTIQLLKQTVQKKAPKL